MPFGARSRVERWQVLEARDGVSARIIIWHWNKERFELARSLDDTCMQTAVDLDLIGHAKKSVEHQGSVAW